MPEFISKLQYKTYEKGEYSDEKARSLEETFKLIRDFPWDQQRGADVQLTGPSVAIQDEYLNYLKVGLYFNGKFCLYYFDANHHLYEYHTDNLDEACKQVDDFFNSQLDTGKFEKKLLSVGSKSHFETACFEYRVNKTKVVLTIFFISVLFLFVASVTVIMPKLPGPAALIVVPYLFIDFIYLSAMVLYIRVFLRSKDMYLQISSGNDGFRFGLNQDAAENYDKKNIARINIYGSSRNASGLKIIESEFNDGTSIRFSGSLIDDITFAGKFHGVDVNRITMMSKVWVRLWNFGK